MRCGALTRQKTPCRSHPVHGAARCRMHGGTQPVGVASPNYVHGDRSAFLPNRLLQRYRGAMTDPELLNMGTDLGLIETRLADVLGRVDTGDAGETWFALQAAWDDLRVAQRAKNPDRVQLCAAKVEQAITKANQWAADGPCSETEVSVKTGS